ncbi:outer membrane protein assembly factor BamB family protein [Halomicrobium zhouii]|uniref:outer membrane protein assembly factor BamB family protein n=1 Tax=Halomicrobium zhouii TaxID=767519 RepID=UPI0015A57DC0|nr:PQQ-binding-like beta-propeller repeat protein [Halomicrobium zhouii]
MSVAASTQAFAQTEVEQSDNSSVSADETTPAFSASSGASTVTTDDGPAPYASPSWSDSFTGEPTDDPVIVDDTAYVGVATERTVDTQVGAVAAYDTDAGALRWDRTGLGIPGGSPTVVDDTVYVATSAEVPRNPSMDPEDGEGGLYALDSETGETNWVRNETELWYGPVVHENDRLYATRGPDMVDVENRTGPTKSPTIGESSVVSLNPDTGETLWSVAADDLVGVTGDTAYAWSDDDIVAYDAETGNQRWSTAADRFIGVTNGTVYTAAGGDLVASDAATGDELWRTALPENVNLDTATVTTDAIYAVSNESADGARTYAFSTADGSVRWNVEVASDATSVNGPTVADGDVFVVAENGSRHSYDGGALVRLDAATGAEEWRFEPPTRGLYGAASVANDSVYVAGNALTEAGEPGEADEPPSAALYAIDRQSGDQLWGYAAGSFTYRSTTYETPTVVDGDLYVLSHGDTVYPQDSSAAFQVMTGSSTPPDEQHLPSDGFFEEDTAPRAAISTTETNPDDEFGENKTVVLNASASSVNRGNITTFEWDVDDDGTFERTGEEISVTLEPCTFRTVRLRVTTDGGATDTESVDLSNG